MRVVKISPTRALNGTLDASPSKSYSHRVFLAGLLAKRPVTIMKPLVDGDVGVTMDACRAFGATITLRGEDTYVVTPPAELTPPPHPVDVKNSGTTARILAAIAALTPGMVEFRGLFFEKGRPMTPLLDALDQLGVKARSTTSGIQIHGGGLRAGRVNIRGDVSSQFITSLLMVLPLAREHGGTAGHRSTITLTTPLKSRPYVDLTVQVLAEFGIRVQHAVSGGGHDEYHVPASQSYPGRTYRVPGDFSSAAFPLVAAGVMPEASRVTIRNLDLHDVQGDKRVVEVLQEAGVPVRVDVDEKTVIICHEGAQAFQKRAFEIRGTNIPDLVPILAVLATQCRGQSVLRDLEHVRYKETDRVRGTSQILQSMNATVTETRDSLLISGPTPLRGAFLDCRRDHRLIMAGSIAALLATGPSRIPDFSFASDSYPQFYEDLTELGVSLEFQDRAEKAVSLDNNDF